VQDAVFNAGATSVTGFSISGQQHLIQRSRAVGDRIRAFTMMSGIQGPNAVVDFTAIGEGALVSLPMRLSTGVLLDNVRVQDEAGALAGEIGIHNRDPEAHGHGWGGANSVVWNSHAAAVIVDNPPTAQNWVVGCSAALAQGTGYFGNFGAAISLGSSGGVQQPQSLYRAQLAESLGPAALVAGK